jgi:Ca2+-binding EF-hand superfamily protein
MKKLMDPQSSGEVDFASFFSTIASYIRPVYTEAELEAVFNEIAGPNCDVIDDKTMQLCIHHLGMDLTLERCQEVIREVDRTGDCTINRADFIAWIQEHRT